MTPSLLVPLGSAADSFEFAVQMGKGREKENFSGDFLIDQA